MDTSLTLDGPGTPVATAARLTLAGGLLINGPAMLIVPDRWFFAVPGVADTGPLNLHLVRDVGAAYAVAGLGVGWHVCAGPAARAAAWCGAAFLLAHAGVHLAEVALGLCGWARFRADAPGVLLPALAAAWSASAGPAGRAQEARDA